MNVSIDCDGFIIQRASRILELVSDPREPRGLVD